MRNDNVERVMTMKRDRNKIKCRAPKKKQRKIVDKKGIAKKRREKKVK